MTAKKTLRPAVGKVLRSIGELLEVARPLGGNPCVREFGRRALPFMEQAKGLMELAVT